MVRRDWFLLKRGRERVDFSYFNKTALHIALERGRSQMAALLLREGARFDLTFSVLQLQVVTTPVPRPNDKGKNSGNIQHKPNWRRRATVIHRKNALTLKSAHSADSTYSDGEGKPISAEEKFRESPPFA